MANSDKNIFITPNTGTDSEPIITLTGYDNNPIILRVLDNNTLSFEGSAGQVFSISPELTGTIFSVNDISGIPSIEVDDTGEIRLAEFGGNIAIGKSIASTKLDVNGTVTATEFAGPLSGNATTATTLATTRTFDITGDITATAVSFNGSQNVSISASVNDDSHNHIISNIDTLQTVLDGKIELISSPILGNVPTIESNGSLVDSGVSITGFATGERYALHEYLIATVENVTTGQYDTVTFTTNYSFDEEKDLLLLFENSIYTLKKDIDFSCSVNGNSLIVTLVEAKPSGTEFQALLVKNVPLDGNTYSGVYVSDGTITNDKLATDIKVGSLGDLTSGITNSSVISAINDVYDSSLSINSVVAAGSTKELIHVQMSDNDYFRLLVGGESNAGYVEFATADDGTEPIYIRQYSGVFNTIVHEVIVLNESGNSIFPGEVSANSFLANGYTVSTESYVDTAIANLVDSSPVNGATTQSISSDWAFDHANNISAHHTKYTDSEALSSAVSSAITNGDTKAPSGDSIYAALYEYTINPKFATTIGLGNDAEVIKFNDATNETVADYWAGKDGLYFQGDSNSIDAVVIKSGNLYLSQNAYIVGKARVNEAIIQDWSMEQDTESGSLRFVYNG